MRRTAAIAAVLALLLAPPLFAQEEETEGVGEVRIPVEVYNQLVESARTPQQLPRPAPASHALGSAKVTVTVAGNEAQPSGEVRVELSIQVLENEWVLIPVLPTGTPVESASVNGATVELITSPWGLAWSTQSKGAYNMALAYRVDASASEAGFSLAVPVPQAAAVSLNATLPGTGLDVAVIPSAGTRTVASGNSTRVTATVPTTSGVQISWRTPGTQGHALSRAVYVGTLTGNAVTWTGELRVELFSDQTLTLGLLPRTATLRQLQVDGQEAAILVDGGRFATLVRGRGRHTVTVGFEVPVVRGDGPPHIALEVPEVPVSRFDLALPGRKEVTVTPASNVTTRIRGETTQATANVPLTRSVAITWAEAVPE
ncbi:MAG: hypothetical protein GY856_10760, partial [bacterium]|nr:hypothetical protein [bacterium]